MEKGHKLVKKKLQTSVKKTQTSIKIFKNVKKDAL